jgi:hypothetical protein
MLHVKINTYREADQCTKGTILELTLFLNLVYGPFPLLLKPLKLRKAQRTFAHRLLFLSKIRKRIHLEFLKKAKEFFYKYVPASARSSNNERIVGTIANCIGF